MQTGRPIDEIYYELPAEAPEPLDSGDFDIAKYLNGLRRRWALIIVVCLLSSGFALIRYSLTPKEYQASTIIQIERKRLSLLALGQAGWLEDWWNQEYYPTQYRLLRSRGMAERVVMNLRLHEDPAFTGRPAARLLPPGEERSTSADDGAELAAFAARLQSGLGVNPIEDTQLVELIYRSTSPALTARIVNGYAEAFIQWGVETRNSTVGRASDTLSAQIESLRAEVEESQRRLNAFAHDQENVLDPAGEALLERRRTLETQYNQVATERITKEVSYRQLRDSTDTAIANRISGGLVPELEDEIFRLESEYRTKLEIYKPEWPDMIELRRAIDEKRGHLDRLVGENVNQLRDQAYQDYLKARQEEEKISEEIANLVEEGRKLNSSALEYNNLLTLINTRKELLNELLKRQSQTEVASRVQTAQDSNVRIVDTAVVPRKAFRPHLGNELTRALFLGLVLSVGSIVLLEYLDRTIKTGEELEALLRLPNLAVIPDVDERRRGKGWWRRYGKSSYGYGYGYGYGARREKKDDSDSEVQIELLPHHEPRLAICEAYRSLRTALLLSSAEALKRVAVTSAEPSEGKTATTVNLAVVLAQLGRRVLVIDCDLRRPRIHQIFQVSNRFGLVNFLTGEGDPERLFLETQVPNLWVCPSGPTPPNPSELLASDHMTECLAEAERRFDLVLIDTPPVLPVADAVIVGTRVDGVVLCVRTGVLRRDDARDCRERLKYEEIKILGTVLNRYTSRAGRYETRYKYYGAYEEPPSRTRSAA